MAYETLHQRLRGPVVKALKEKLGTGNTHALPQLDKVVVNVGINKSKMDSKEMHAYIEDCLMRITGQKPVFTRARQAISNFKTRTGMVVGCRVTLRGQNMEEFLDRLLSYGLPRIRDFRGLPTKLDGNGNYSIGLRDHSIFPEVPPPDAKQIFGLQVVISTTAQNDEEGMALLKEIGVPFRRSESEQEEETKPKAEAKPEEKAEEEPKKEEESVAQEAPTEDTTPTEESTSDSQPES